MKLEDHIKGYFPLKRDEKEEFEIYIQRILNDFIKEVENSNELLEIEDKDFKPEKFIKEVRVFSKVILSSIGFYFKGKPNLSYNRLSKALNFILNKKEFSVYKTGTIVDKGSYKFYRIRVKSDNKSFSKKDLFHVPFSQRRKVSTSRYSIPGVPSLYLSNSIYVAWEELQRPKFETINVSRFENVVPLNVLNLKIDEFIKTSSKSNVEFLSKIFRFPLVFVCSIKVNNHEDVFKPEYIISQLLLQWISDKNYDLGIMYSSSHVDLTNTNNIGRFINVVFPVKNFEFDYCKKLAEIFKMTSVLSSELNQLNNNPKISTGIHEAFYYSNEHIKSVELINGIKTIYKNTAFSYLESVLDELPSEKIELI